MLHQDSYKIDPTNFKSNVNYALALRYNRFLKKAQIIYNKAINLIVKDADSLHEQAKFCIELELFNEGLKRCDKALKLNPKHHLALSSKGLIYTHLENPLKAIQYYKKSLYINPGCVEALQGLGSSYVETLDFKKSLKYFKKALLIGGDNLAIVHNNIGYTCFQIGKFKEAETSFLKSIALDKNYSLAHSNLSKLYLRSEKFEKGWQEYEWRLYKDTFSSLFGLDVNINNKRWHKNLKINNKIILVRSEQGLGDTIQFCKYVKLLNNNNNKIILQVQDPLVELIKTLDNEISVISNNKKYINYDYHVPLLSLPLEFKTNKNNFPDNGPYLKAQQTKINYWKNKFSKMEFNIGVAWHGSNTKAGKQRSFSLANFEKISKIKGVNLISLQKGLETKQIRQFSSVKIKCLGSNFDNGEQAFLDTAGLMKNLDLIITCDTSIAHVAGSLGRKTWILLRHLPDWRWFWNKSSSPWYSNTLLFRQKNPDNWKEVFNNVENELLRLLSKK